MALIGFGSCSKYYAYIFTLVLSRFICDYLEGFNEKEYYNKPNQEKFTEFASIFAYHPLFRDLMYFLGALICGIVFYFFYRRDEKEKEEGKMDLKSFSLLKKQILGETEDFGNKLIALISLIYAGNIMIRTFLMSMKFDAGFWTVEILFVIYLSIRILKVKIGNHQKVTIFILAIILFGVQIVNSFLQRSDHGCTDEQCKEENINDNNLWVFMAKKFGNGGWIVLILFLYIIDFIMRDYSWVKLKFLMDIKSIPVFNIILIIGIVGSILIILCLIIVTNVPCNYIENIKKIENDYIYIDTNKPVEFIKQVCGVIEYDENSKKLSLYYDNFYIFISDYTNSSRQGLEIGILFIYFISNFFINFSHAMILKHLDPNAMLVNINFNYLVSRLITYIKHNAEKEYMTIELFILLELCEILAIIAYMIYIELIELKFCNFDFHIKKRIEERSEKDTRMNSMDNINYEVDDDVYGYKIYLNDNNEKMNKNNKNDKSIELDYKTDD